MKKNHRILIIDDDSFIREALKEILAPDESSVLIDEKTFVNEDLVNRSKYNYELIFSDNGNNGVKEVEKAINDSNPFSVAFVDMKMPGMDGAQTAKKIWEIDSQIKIVIITAFDESPPEEIIKIVGREDIYYLRKPFNEHEISQFARALSNQWAIEQELNMHKQNLENMICDRTTELQKAYELIKKLDKDKGTFLKYLYHELNTPLYHMVALDLLDTENMKDSEKNYYNIAIAGRDRLTNLISEFLDYFDIPNKILPKKDWRNITIDKTLQNVIQKIKQKNPNRKIIVKKVVYDSFLADPICFQKVLTILLNNAISFSENEIIVHSEFKDKTIYISIIDNGKGIKQSDLLTIFEPFSNEEFKRHDKGGYGLNLSKAKIIAEVHGWNIWAESGGLDKGSKFVLAIKKLNNM